MKDTIQVPTAYKGSAVLVESNRLEDVFVGMGLAHFCNLSFRLCVALQELPVLPVSELWLVVDGTEVPGPAEVLARNSFRRTDYISHPHVSFWIAKAFEGIHSESGPIVDSFAECNAAAGRIVDANDITADTLQQSLAEAARLGLEMHDPEVIAQGLELHMLKSRLIRLIWDAMPEAVDVFAQTLSLTAELAARFEPSIRFVTMTDVDAGVN